MNNIHLVILINKYNNKANLQREIIVISKRRVYKDNQLQGVLIELYESESS